MAILGLCRVLEGVLGGTDGGRAESPGVWLLHSLAGLCWKGMPSTCALVHSQGCWVKAISHRTSCQHGTSLNMGKELVPEQTSGVEERSHGGVIWYASTECGKSLRQSAPQWDSSGHSISRLPSQGDLIKSRKPTSREPWLPGRGEMSKSLRLYFKLRTTTLTPSFWETWKM